MGQNLGNRIVTAIVRSPLHPILGPDFALIEFTGRRSGRTYTTPINAFAEGDGYLVISRADRIWWRNLRDGASAMLRHKGVEQSVKAEVIDSPGEVEHQLKRHLAARPAHARYFGLATDASGQLDPARLAQASRGRVFIRLS
ncbi:MAG: nitroreductase/quinone reductase family protein, partial [Anaerolineales bacterium]|nr:nitroreductase/quinone reductase family protein [Anaerolineales bacterium]